MERAAFLIESSNERIVCMLNPETLVMRRSAGIRPRESLSGELSGRYRSDDPLLYTGGGRTELTMDLLFDVTLAGSSLVSRDVRNLTRPFWDLSENEMRRSSAPYYSQPPTVRFVWGKAWNMPGVVASISERLEYINDRGVPQRSWMRMQMIRTQDDPTGGGQTGVVARDVVIPALNRDDVLAHEITGAGDTTERLDELAQRYYGDPSLWRLIAEANDVDDPMQLVAGAVLRIPPLNTTDEEQ